MEATRAGAARSPLQVAGWLAVLALVAWFGAVPFAKAWHAREQQIASARTRLAQLSAVVNNRAAVDQQASATEALLESRPTRVLHARSEALAASALQSLVQEMADAGNLSVTRLDVTRLDARTADVSVPNPARSTGVRSSADTGSTTAVRASNLPVTISANGDIVGVASLLQHIRSGRQLLVVDKLSLQVNSALRGAPDVLQLTMTLHAPVIVQ